MVARATAAFVSFTEVSPPSAHRSYNAWHQLDHLPEQYRVAGVVRGERWAATPRCRRARLVDGEPLDASHYFTLYLLAEPVEQTLEEFLALGARLRAEGRFFEDRRAVLAGPLRLADVRAAPAALVSAETVPFRPSRGIYVVADAVPGPVAGLGASLVETCCLEGPALDAVLAVEGVAGVLQLVPDPELVRGRLASAGTSSTAVTVVFLDGDVLETAARLDVLVGAKPHRPSARALQRGPYEAVLPFEWDLFDDASRT
jgi:hypothetical protein